MMRAFHTFSVYCFILAIVFLSRASATPMHSDCMGIFSRKTKLRNHVERVNGNDENSQAADEELEDWVQYFKRFWDYMYEEEPCHHPMPSPSESPIPDGVGEFPKKTDSKKSEKGFNQGAYKKFILNELFYVDFEEEAPAEIYDETKATIHTLMKRAERGSLNKEEAKKWKGVAAVMLKCYKHEKGAIFFDVAFSQRWTICGWVEMKNTFVPTEKYMRMCVSLLSLGMDDITRPPEEGKDFIVPGESDPQEIEEMLEPMLANSGRQILNKTLRSESVTVDLLDYPDYCDTPLDIDPNCYAFCCLTPYYGSEFCRDCGF